MKYCCVPGCREKKGLHRIPFTKKSLWKHWSKLCPFFKKYTLRQLENLRICKNHFIPEHYDYERRRLKWCSLPLLNVPGIKVVMKDDNKYTFLEIYPIIDSEHLNFKVVSPCNLNQFLTDEVENVKHRNPYLVILKAESTHGLPVDHSMYCSPFETRHDSSVTAVPSNCIKYKAETSSIECETLNVKCISSIQSGGLNKETVVHGHTEQHKQVTEQSSAAVDCSVTNYVQLLTQLATLINDTDIENNADTESCEDYSSTVDLYDIITGITSHLRSSNLVQENEQIHSQIFEKVKNKQNPVSLNLTIKPLLNTAEIPASSSKEKIIQPYAQDREKVLSEDSKLKVYYESSFDQINNQFTSYNQSSVMNVNNSVQLSLCKSDETQKSLLTEPYHTAEMLEQPHSAFGAPYKPGLRSTSGTTFYPSMQNSITEKNTEASHSQTCKDKENSKPDEKINKLIHKRYEICKKKLKLSNNRCRRLQIKLDRILAKAKTFLKAYPHLSGKTKELIETQLRLARQKPGGARYNEDEKLFAQRLFQISPDCYRFMQQYLKLPSKSTLQHKI